MTSPLNGYRLASKLTPKPKPIYVLLRPKIALIERMPYNASMRIMSGDLVKFITRCRLLTVAKNIWLIRV